MNLSTRRIWCYECKREVFLEVSTNSYNDSDQETETCTARSRDSGHGSYSTLRTNTPERGIYCHKYILSPFFNILAF